MKTPERKKISLTSLGPPLRTGNNGWINYPCPSCQDGKAQHFWVSPDKEMGWCHKCTKWIAISNTEEEAAVFPEGVDVLKNVLTATLTKLGISGDKEGRYMKEAQRELVYRPLDLTQLAGEWESFDIWEAQGFIREEVLRYIQARGVFPIDLANTFCKILTPKAAEYRAHPNMFNHRQDPRFDLFFPIFRGGVMVGGWLRGFNIAVNRDGKTLLPRWRSVGLQENGALLYTSALPSAALDPNTEKKFPLVLVESPVGATRLARMGWWAVGLGGKSLTAKGKLELIKLPPQDVIILLDEDAEEQAVALWSKLQGIKRAIVVGRIPHKGKDPEDLDDKQLREVLIATAQLLRESVKAREAGDMEASNLAELALTGEVTQEDLAKISKGLETKEEELVTDIQALSEAPTQQALALGPGDLRPF